MKNYFGCPVKATSNVLGAQMEGFDRLAPIVRVRQQAEGLIGQRGVDKWFLPLESLSAIASWAVLFELGVYRIEICDRSSPIFHSPVLNCPLWAVFQMSSQQPTVLERVARTLNH